jgi:hypothetical protein
MQYIEITAETKLKYCPLPAYEKMEAYTYSELGKRPYKYQKGLYGIKVCKKPVYTIKAVV